LHTLLIEKFQNVWSDAFLTTCYLYNLMLSSMLDSQIPYSLLHPHEELFVLPLKIFECVCFVRNNRPDRTKLELY